MQSSPLSLPLTLFHWILFLEAVYCIGFIGLAYGLGEGFSAVLDIAIRVLLFREGWEAAALLYVYPIFVTGPSAARQRLMLFPWSR